MEQVELVSLGGNGVTVGELLTVPISPRVKWLNRHISVGDAGLQPAEPVLERFKRLGMPDFFERYDLTTIADDELSTLLKVGADGDGNEYVFGPRSERFYEMEHEVESFKPVADTGSDFIQWVIREHSDHLVGCPWQVFLSEGPFEFREVWHREYVDPEPLFEEAKRIGGWSREYIGPGGFELHSAETQINLRFKRDHRGRKSRFDVMWAGASSATEGYLEWLAGRGFGRVWE